VEAWLKTLGRILTDNLNKSMLPFPIDKSVCTRWAKGIPRGGPVILYTSCLYQLAPFIEEFVKWLERVGVSERGIASVIVSIGQRVAGLVMRPKKELLDKSYRVLSNIVELLVKHGVEFGYLYEDEPYSGAILYELGYEDEFAEYCRRVVDVFKRYGVRKVITVDPHTHYILSSVYPKFVKLDVEVVNYLDLIKDVRPRVKVDVVIHDPCLYARFLGKRDVYRNLLDRAGVNHVEDPYVTGREASMCCGGPIESIMPSLSSSIAKVRLEKLRKLSENVVVLCPICMANLLRNAPQGVKVIDFAELVE